MPVRSGCSPFLGRPSCTFHHPRAQLTGPGHCLLLNCERCWSSSQWWHSIGKVRRKVCWATKSGKKMGPSLVVWFVWIIFRGWRFVLWPYENPNWPTSSMGGSYFWVHHLHLGICPWVGDLDGQFFSTFRWLQPGTRRSAGHQNRKLLVSCLTARYLF